MGKNIFTHLQAVIALPPRVRILSTQAGLHRKVVSVGPLFSVAALLSLLLPLGGLWTPLLGRQSQLQGT